MRRPGPLPSTAPRRDPVEVSSPAGEPTGFSDGLVGPPIPIPFAAGSSSESDTVPLSELDLGLLVEPGAPEPNHRANSAGLGPWSDSEGADSGWRSDTQSPVTAAEVWRARQARRRVLRHEIRRFTKSARRRRRSWLIGLGALLTLVALSFGAAYSPLFAVEKISVQGTQTLDAEQVALALSDQLNRPLALVDTAEIKSALMGFPLIESYAIEARPPHELTVRIIERTPIGVFSSAAGYVLVDAAGVVLSTTPEIPAGHPVLDIPGGVDSPGFKAAGQVIRTLPQPIRQQLARVSASSSDDVRLTLDNGVVVVWGSADDSPLKSVVLERAMQIQPPETGTRLYDVSSPGALVVG